jgi:DNA primase
MVGMQVPESQPRSREQAQRETERKDQETSLVAVTESAMEFYRAELKKSPRAIEYLKGRGLTGEVAARFRIGYAPDDWQGLKGAFPDYEHKSLVEAGLVIANEGKRYDRFRDRIMFPILNARGAVIGFGGRVLGEGEPKYLNSPETALFEKGREVYGLVQARDAMRAAGRVLVVEGYMDVVALAQFDVGYAVATLGTATTPVHVRSCCASPTSSARLRRRQCGAQGGVARARSQPAARDRRQADPVPVPARGARPGQLHPQARQGRLRAWCEAPTLRVF